MRRAPSQPTETTTCTAPSEGEALLRAVVGALARAAARQAFATATEVPEPEPHGRAASRTAST